VSTKENYQDLGWREWALTRLDELVSAALVLDDEDFDLPQPATISEAKNFVQLMSHQNVVSDIGQPRIWLSQNADFVFEWAREGAKLEFKFTPQDMHVFVKAGDVVFTEVHKHSSSEQDGLAKAISMYQQAA
jgi:hypothetical protein